MFEAQGNVSYLNVLNGKSISSFFKKDFCGLPSR
jgi:hypothetical protein